MRSSLCLALLFAACTSKPPTVTDGGNPDGGGDGGTGSPVDAIPITASLTATGITHPVDVVRDQWGIPHVYGESIPDVAYAQGYFMAKDRWVELDLLRRAADGSLSGVLGGIELTADIGMRVHHLRKTAETGLANLKASSDPSDQLLVQTLNAFADGVNAWQADLAAGKYALPAQLASYYSVASVTPWLPEDSVLLGEFLAWQLAFDDQTDVIRTDLDLAVQTTFAGSDPRAKMNLDLENTIPPDPAVIVDGGWNFNLDNSTARRDSRSPAEKRRRAKALRQYKHLLDEDLKALARVGFVSPHDAERGSNNWVIGPQLSATGHVLVANDTHLSLQNPPIFYMNHLVARSGGTTLLDVMGEQFPGVPAVTLGMNQHVAWGATVNYIDVTDIYSIAVQKCSDGVNYCTTFKGQPVQLVPRQESFDEGTLGNVTKAAVTVTLYDDPNHGPILPRVDVGAGGTVSVEPLGSTELSVKYTGYTSAPLLKAIYGLDVSTSMQSAVAALDPNFRYGGQNWVIGDDQGNYGWTQTVEVPLRSPTAPPYKVLPGDGTAEWGPDMDPHFIPHAYNHPQGYIATANNDPIGTTLHDDPYYGQPIVSGEPADGGSHLYLGADYDPGTREGRIHARIDDIVADGGKLSLDDMSSIQADAISEYGQMFAPTFIDVTGAMAQEFITHTGGDGGPSDVSAYAYDAGGSVQNLFGPAHDLVQAWSFDTPSGINDKDAGAPTAQQLSDSTATLIMAVWEAYYAHAILDDELAALGPGGAPFQIPDVALGNAAVRLTLHPELTQSAISPVTGDPILFDDLTTPGIVESKRQIAARAAVGTLQYLASNLGPTVSGWRWGSIHTLTLAFALPVGLDIPPPSNAEYPAGFPRHGADGTVDVGGSSLSKTDFTYDHGPAIRFTCELDPAGPHGRNVLPGGEVFDPTSPHYADQMELWRKNQTIDWSFQDADVVTAAQAEYQTNGIGRTHFEPAQ